MKPRLVLAGSLLLLTGLALADQPKPPPDVRPLAGTWRLQFGTNNGPVILLVRLSETDGRWQGELLGNAGDAPKVSVTDVAVAEGLLTLKLKAGDLELAFEGRLPQKADAAIRGTLLAGNQLLLANMEPTRLTALDDRFALAREELARITEPSPQLFELSLLVVSQAAAKKLSAEEIRRIVDKATKAAELYGPRWERQLVLRLARLLVTQDGFSEVALATARQAERQLTGKEPAAVQIDVLETVLIALKTAKKEAEIADLEKRIAQLEAKDLTEYRQKWPFQPEAFTGRKGESDRVVLLELFTETDLPLTAAAGLAFDGIAQTFKPSEVVLLQYALSGKRPGPLANPDAAERAKFYAEKADEIPTVLFNGRADVESSGLTESAKTRYREFREVIEPLLEKPAGAKLTVSAKRRADTVEIQAKVSDLAKTGEQVRLRLALAEDMIRFDGGNGLRFHQAVVRAFPGGVKGIALPEKAGTTQTVTVKIDELRQRLDKYLDGLAREKKGTFTLKPLALKHLRVVAFVQNDETGEVLQAAQVPVTNE